MESAEEPVEKQKIKINHVIHTKVAQVEHVTRKRWLRGYGGDALFAYEDGGWWIHFQGSFEKIFFGMEQPDYKIGDEVKITFEKVDHA